MSDSVSCEVSSVVELITSGDIDGLTTHCEDCELNAPNGVATPEIYGTLLAVYLLRNELDHAKLLWKRIPGSVKVSSPEIGELWEIGRRLWKRSFSEIYSLIEKGTWPPHIEPLLSQLNDKLKSRVLQLVSQAYSSITLTEVCQMLGLEESAALSAVMQQGWTFDEATSVLTPKQLKSSFLEIQEPKERLARLVDIVSFLEN